MYHYREKSKLSASPGFQSCISMSLRWQAIALMDVQFGLGGEEFSTIFTYMLRSNSMFRDLVSHSIVRSPELWGAVWLTAGQRKAEFGLEKLVHFIVNGSNEATPTL